MRLPKKIPSALLSASLAVSAAIPAAYAQPPSSDPPEEQGFEVPGGDIFGFTSPTDVGETGDRGLALELSGRAGKRRGSYWSPTLKTQFSYTLADNFAIALSPFVTAHRIPEVPDLDDRTSTGFDGFSGEIAYRFIERSATNPFAATFSMEPRTWLRRALARTVLCSRASDSAPLLQVVIKPLVAVTPNMSAATSANLARIDRIFPSRLEGGGTRDLKTI